MLIRLLADLHLNSWPDKPDFLWRQVDVLHAILKAKPKPDLVVVCGDVFHARAALTAETIKAARAVLSSSPAHCYVLRGNHDMPLRQSAEEVDSLVALRDLCVVECIHKPHVYDVYPPHLAFVPYSEPLAMLSDLDAVLQQKPDFVFGHCLVVGSTMSSGYVVDRGLPADVFSKPTFLGDVHMHQVVRPGLVYVGAPYPLTFGDTQADAYGHIDLNTQTGKWTHKPNKTIRFVTVPCGQADPGATYVRELPVVLPEETDIDVDVSASVKTVLASYAEANTVSEAARAYVSGLEEPVSAYGSVQLTVGQVEAENFMSLEKVSISIPEREVVLIEGDNTSAGVLSNGAGKSALIELVYFALYGRPLRDGAKVSDVWRTGTKRGEVRFVGAVNGKPIVITRTRGKTPVIDFAGTKGAMPQAQLDCLLGMSGEAFQQVVVFGQGVKEVFAASTEAKRKELIEQLLGLDRFGVMLAQVNADVSQAEAMRSTLAQELAGATGRLQEIDNQLDKLPRHVNTAAVKRELAALEKKIAAASSAKDTSDLSGALDKLHALDVERVRLERERKTIETGLAQEVSAVADKVCPLCRQAIAGMSAGYVKRDMQAKRERLCVLVQDLGSVAGNTKLAEEHVAACRQKSELFLAQRGSLSDMVRRKCELNVLLATDKQAIDLALRRECVSEEQREATAGIAEVDGMLETLQEARALLGRKGLRMHLLRTVLPALSKAAAAALRVLDPLLGVTVESDGERLDFTAWCEGGAPSYAMLSGGQKRKVDLAVCWAIANRFHRCNVLFVDEAFDGLDRVGGDKVVQLLRTAERTVLCVTHQADMKDEFDTVWTVTRDKSGISRVEVA